MNTLIRIKRLILRGKALFTEKAAIEIARDNLTPELVLEAIINAPSITKTISSRKSNSGDREKLYVISGITYSGLVIYTKGKFLKRDSEELFYILISSKRFIE